MAKSVKSIDDTSVVGAIDYAKIARVLAGEIETTVLTEEEKAVWSEQFLRKMSEPGPGEEAFFANLRVRPQGGG